MVRLHVCLTTYYENICKMEGASVLPLAVSYKRKFAAVPNVVVDIPGPAATDTEVVDPAAAATEPGPEAEVPAPAAAAAPTAGEAEAAPEAAAGWQKGRNGKELEQINLCLNKCVFWERQIHRFQADQLGATRNKIGDQGIYSKFYNDVPA